MGAMPSLIKRFSDAMKMSYVGNALANDPESSRKFQELRSGTKNDALVYLKGILPFCEEVIINIHRLFEYFKHFEGHELVKQLKGMLDEIRQSRKLCDVVKTLHEDLMVDLKKRDDEAQKVTSELRALEKEYKNKQSDFERSAALKRKAAIGFAFFPGVGLIVAPALLAASISNKKDAQLQGLQAKSKDDAATALSESFQPGLLAFIEALGEVAGFFSELEGEVQKCHGHGESCIKEGVLSPLHKLLKINALKITEMCSEFRRVLPSVKVDFKHICRDDGSDGTEVDHDYVLKKLRNMLEMTEGLDKQKYGIMDHLQRQIQRQTELAYPAGKTSCKETYKFYVDYDD